MQRHPNIVNLDELDPWEPPRSLNRPERFGGSAKRLAAAAGNQKLGASYFKVPSGKTAVPFHAHHNSEEAIFVLEGKGTLRLGDARIPVRAGDWIAIPAGEAHAHQLIADQGETLAYLCVSTQHEVDVITYPDSGKLMAAVTKTEGALRHMFRRTDGGVGYFDGED